MAEHLGSRLAGVTVNDWDNPVGARLRAIQPRRTH